MDTTNDHGEFSAERKRMPEETYWVSAAQPSSEATYIFAPADRSAVPAFTVNRLFFFRRPLAVQPLLAALERVLSRVPLLAGRAREGNRLEASNEGVPVVTARSACAGSELGRGSSLLARERPGDPCPFAETLDAARVDAGLEAVLAIRLTTFADDACCLAFSFWHGLFDGGASAAFCKALAAATRGEPFELSLPTVAPTTPPPHAQPTGFRLLPPPPAEAAPVVEAPAEAWARSESVHFGKNELTAMKGRCARGGADPRISTHDALIAHVWRLVHNLPGRAAPSPASFVVDCRRRLPASQLGMTALGNHHLNLNTPDVDVGQLGEGHLAGLLRALNTACTEDVVRASNAWLHGMRVEGLLDRVVPGARHVAVSGPSALFITTDWRCDAYALEFGGGAPFWVHGWLSAPSGALPVDNLLIVHDAPPAEGGMDITLQLGGHATADEAEAAWDAFRAALALLRASLTAPSATAQSA